MTPRRFFSSAAALAVLLQSVPTARAYWSIRAEEGWPPVDAAAERLAASQELSKLTRLLHHARIVCRGRSERTPFTVELDLRLAPSEPPVERFASTEHDPVLEQWDLQFDASGQAAFSGLRPPETHPNAGAYRQDKVYSVSGTLGIELGPEKGVAIASLASDEHSAGYPRILARPTEESATRRSSSMVWASGQMDLGMPQYEVDEPMDCAVAGSDPAGALSPKSWWAQHAVAAALRLVKAQGGKPGAPYSR